MAHKGKHGGGHDDGGGGGHGDRPWVYFMIDSFFLVTQFFVLTFKVKVDEVALPQRLPPGGSQAQRKDVQLDMKKKLSVHVSHTATGPAYEFMQKTVDLAGLNQTLAGSVSSGTKYQVKVSYEPDVPFADVLAVFNACSRVKIDECGLVPLRGMQAAPGAPR